MAELRGKSVLVVGASGALGSLIATELAFQGAVVMGTASSIESAERIPSQVSPRLLLNLEEQGSIEVLVDYVRDAEIPIDGVVNAAGLVAFGPIADLAPETIRRLFAVNVSGPMQLLAGLVEALRVSAAKGNSPFLVNISGVVAENPLPQMAAYSATKSAINAFDRAIGRELRREGIRVLDARPSHTETGLAGRAIAGVAPNFREGMDPSSVAKRIVQAIIAEEDDLPSTAFQNG